MELSNIDSLPIDILSGIFTNTTNSYKYYWFLSILEQIKEGNNIICIRDLLTKMAYLAYYPVVKFKINFGIQDKLQLLLQKVHSHNLDLKINLDDFTNIIKVNYIKDLDNLGKYVPYRFQRPFFRNQLKGEKDYLINRLIIDLTGSSNTVIYYYEDDKIHINDKWIYYFKKHMKIITDFIKWELLIYLGKKNPNIPNLAFKLNKDHKRDQVTSAMN